MEYFTFGAEQEDVGTRIDVFLADAMENLSRSGVQKLIEEGHITLNGGRTKANYKLRERDIIDVEVPEVKEVEILPEDIPRASCLRRCRSIFYMRMRMSSW